MNLLARKKASNVLSPSLPALLAPLRGRVQDQGHCSCVVKREAPLPVGCGPEACSPRKSAHLLPRDNVCTRSLSLARSRAFDVYVYMCADIYMYVYMWIADHRLFSRRELRCSFLLKRGSASFVDFARLYRYTRIAKRLTIMQAREERCIQTLGLRGRSCVLRETITSRRESYGLLFPRRAASSLLFSSFRRSQRACTELFTHSRGCNIVYISILRLACSRLGSMMRPIERL